MKNWIMGLAGVALMVGAGFNVKTYLSDKAYIEAIKRETDEQDDRMKAADRYTNAMKELRRMKEDLERQLGR